MSCMLSMQHATDVQGTIGMCFNPFAHYNQVYNIWYGWDSSATTTATKNILTDMINSIGSTPWWMISTTYPDHTGQRVSPDVHLVAATSVSEDDPCYQVRLAAIYALLC